MALTSPAKGKEETKDVYAEYQKNTTLAMNLQAEVLSGLKLGKPLPELLLKALEALSCLTHTDTALTQAKEDLAAMYAYVLEEPDSVQLEIDQLETRMARMKEALTADDIPDHDKRVIEAAILAHQKAVRRLQHQE